MELRQPSVLPLIRSTVADHGTDHTLDGWTLSIIPISTATATCLSSIPGQYNVTTIGYDPQIGAELLAITGKIYPRSMQQDNKVYSYYLQTSDMSDYYMGIFYRPAWENGIGFDEKNGRLWNLTATTS